VSFLRFEDVAFSYPGMTRPLLDGLQAHFPQGWTGIVGANGAGKSTLLKLAIGELAPQSGRIHRLASAVYAPQSTDHPPEAWQEFLAAEDAVAGDLRRRLGVREDWIARWATLSHGERKRAQIAVALWSGPDVLALDEPTNHIDADARRLLLDVLPGFRGVGLLVSHDREMLDTLCSQCLFIDPPDACMRPGGVSAGLEQQHREQTSARARDDDVKHAAQRLRDAAQRRREEGERVAMRTKAAKAKKPPMHDHDGRAKRQLAKLTNKDGWAAKQSAQIGLRARQAEDRRADIPVKKQIVMGFWLEGSERSSRNHVVWIPAGAIPLGAGRRLVFPELRIDPADRIALTGANGMGKSTLVRHLLQHVNVPADHLIHVPQEITAAETRRIFAEVARLPKEFLGRVMTSVSRLGSRPQRLIESEQPSPGEIRKILLSLGVVRGPHLIVMDEPTNHMDLPSIACLEQALAECPCAMLLVSHDLRFLDALVQWHWRLVPEGETVRLVVAPWQRLPAAGAAGH
jgi:ATPase subunit of ABC transporter with duplicated ATPase domains